jgi:hypothetical protein
LADGRHASTSRSIKPAYLIAGGVLVLALIVGALVLITGGSDSPLVGGQSPVPTPAFSFTAGKTVVVTTAMDPDQATTQKAVQAAKPTAANAEKMIHDLYSNAFLVPDDWTTGSYDAAFDDFTDEANAEAMKQIDVLTAGSAAGDTFSAIEPGKKTTFTTKVLVDPKGQPYSTVSTVTFTATATKKDGSGAIDIVSKGQYVIEKTADGWKITAFKVNRDDQPTKTAGSGSGATPTAEAS